MARGGTRSASCPCGSGQAADQCCIAVIEGRRTADDAAALMRSRFVAHALGHEAYLASTWHPDTRPASPQAAAAPPVKWLDLRIIAHRPDTPRPGQAVVEFIARYKVNGRAGKLHEISRFVREGGQWYYVDGEFR